MLALRIAANSRGARHRGWNSPVSADPRQEVSAPRVSAIQVRRDLRPAGFRPSPARTCNCARLGSDLLAVPGRDLTDGSFQFRIRELVAQPGQYQGGLEA